MRSIVYLFTLFLLSSVLVHVESIEVSPRYAQDCAYLNAQIYCYGGYVAGSILPYDLISLNVNQNNGNAVQNLNSQWNAVFAGPTGITVDLRIYAQAVAMPDGNRLLIQGGYNAANATIQQQSIAYNAQTNSWEALSDYSDALNGGSRQIYLGSGVSIPELNSIGFYGGYQEHVPLGFNYTPLYNSGQPLTGLVFNNSNGYLISYVGYYYLTLYNIQTDSWSEPVQSPFSSAYHIAQSATYHPNSKKIFYLGGTYHNATDGYTYSNTLSYAFTYNTVNSTWLKEPIFGGSPSPRNLHTATLLPSGDDILLYGGTIDQTEVSVINTTVTDFCYTLNIPTMTWTYLNLNVPDGSSGPRSEHSAVLVNQTSLFILFGLDKDSNPRSDLLVLDVRNPRNISFATEFPFNTATTTSGSSNSSSSTSNSSGSTSSTSLSTGAIGGIAAGGVVAGALVVLALIFLIRKSKKQALGKNNNTSHSEEEQKNNESELLEVDWDKIDEHYKEILLPPQQSQQQPYVPRHSVIDDHHSEPTTSTEGSTRVTATSQIPDVYRQSFDTARKTTISPDVYVSSEGRSSPTIVSPDAVSPMVMRIVKPDDAGQ